MAQDQLLDGDLSLSQRKKQSGTVMPQELGAGLQRQSFSDGGSAATQQALVRKAALEAAATADQDFKTARKRYLAGQAEQARSAEAISKAVRSVESGVGKAASLARMGTPLGALTGVLGVESLGDPNAQESWQSRNKTPDSFGIKVAQGILNTPTGRQPTDGRTEIKNTGPVNKPMVPTIGDSTGVNFGDTPSGPPQGILPSVPSSNLDPLLKAGSAIGVGDAGGAMLGLLGKTPTLTPPHLPDYGSSNTEPQQAPVAPSEAEAATKNTDFGKSVSGGLNWAMKNLPLIPDISSGGKAGLGVSGIAALISPSVDAARAGLTSALGGDLATLSGGQSALSDRAFSKAQRQAAGFNAESKVMSDAISKAGLDILGAKPKIQAPSASASLVNTNAQQQPPVSAVSQSQQAPVTSSSTAASALSQAKAGSFIPPTPSQVVSDKTAPDGWSQTGIGEGLSQIVGRVGKNGVPEFTNDPTAIQGAAAKPRTGIAGVGDGIGGGLVVGQPGDAQRAIEQYGRANEIYREMNQMRRGQELGDNGNQLVVVRDSSRNSDMVNARLDALQAQDNRAQQELGLKRQELGLKRDELAGRSQDSAANRALKARELDMAESTAQLGDQLTQQQIEAGGLSVEQQQRLQGLTTRIQNATTPEERARLLQIYRELTIPAKDRYVLQDVALGSDGMGGIKYGKQALDVVTGQPIAQPQPVQQQGPQSFVKGRVYRDAANGAARFNGMDAQGNPLWEEL